MLNLAARPPEGPCPWTWPLVMVRTSPCGVPYGLCLGASMLCFVSIVGPGTRWRGRSAPPRPACAVCALYHKCRCVCVYVTCEYHIREGTQQEQTPQAHG